MDSESPLCLASLQPGTIAACYGGDRVGRFISRWTRSAFGPQRLKIGPSHVAMLCPSDRSDIPLLWVESTTMCPDPCLIRGTHVSGCQAHDPANRIRTYLAAGGWVDFWRLSDIDRLSVDEQLLLRWILLEHFVKPGISYDTGGAIISGTRVLKLAPFLTADLESVFCSELIAATLQRLHRLNRDNPTKYSPASLLRDLYRQGTYQFCGRIAA